MQVIVIGCNLRIAELNPVGGQLIRLTRNKVVLVACFMGVYEISIDINDEEKITWSNQSLENWGVFLCFFFKRSESLTFVCSHE